MGLFDIFKKKEKRKDGEWKTLLYPSKEEIPTILDKEIGELFPVTGEWLSSCFSRPTNFSKRSLPCHLRDYDWLSEYMKDRLINDKGIMVDANVIKDYIQKSHMFEVMRDNYEQSIVKWQIEYMNGGGEGFLMPKGSNEISFLFSNNVEELFRTSVILTLTRIGMDRDAIEKGLERNSKLWLDRYIRKSFEHEFEPVIYFHGSPDPASEEHRKNWVALRKYDYYRKHKDSINKYGFITPEMNLTAEEVNKLEQILEVQNAERKQYIDEWYKRFCKNVDDALNGEMENE